MMILRCAVLIVLMSILCGGQQFADGQVVEKHDARKDKTMSGATTEFFSKGGIGIIAKDNLWVVSKSAKNELIYGPARDRWSGLDAYKPELVIFFEGRIWSPQGLPDGFDLSRAVVISFESDKIRFFDFGKMSGGYYRRIKE